MLAQKNVHESDTFRRKLDDAVRVLRECEAAVTACACLVFREPDAPAVLSGVRRDMDCADVLATTRRVLARRISGSGLTLLEAQLRSAAIACQISHDFCSAHADHQVEARSCSDATRRALATLSDLSEVFESARPGGTAATAVVTGRDRPA
jgi:hypothetical protein